MSKAPVLKTKDTALTLSLPAITPAMVRSGSFDVTEATTLIGAATRSVAGAGEGIMYPAALTAYASSVAGVWGKGEGAQYAKQGDYAEAIGYSPAMLSRLLLVGRAVVEHGIRKGSKEYAALVGSAVYRAAKDRGVDLAAAIRGDNTPAVLEALRVAMAPAPAEVEGPPQTRAPGGDTDQTEDEADRPTAPPTVGDAREHLRAVESILRSLSDADAVKVEKALRSLADASAKRREVAPTVKGSAEEVTA
jgi:hypothetical protein